MHLPILAKKPGFVVAARVSVTLASKHFSREQHTETFTRAISLAQFLDIQSLPPH
jgi:hypothetical protein